MKKQIGLLFLLIALIASACTKKDTVESIVAKMAEKNGSVANFDKMKGFIMLTEVSVKNSMTIPVKATIFKPNKFRMEIEFMGQRIVQTYNGSIGWAEMGGQVNQIPENELAPMLDNFQFNYGFLMNPIIKYKETGLKVTLLGNEDINGSPTFKLLSISKKNDSTYVYVDKNSFMEVKNVKNIKDPNGMVSKIETYSSDFKASNGINYPQTITVKQNNQEVTKITIKSIELIDKIDMKLFEMPVQTSTPEPTK